jgi:hypothetical protein
LKKAITFFWVCAISAAVSAQYRYDDAVYLKNGAIVHGRIIEVIPHKQLTIETVNRIVLAYQFCDVEKYYKRTCSSEERNRSSVKNKRENNATINFEENHKSNSSSSRSGIRRGYQYIGETGFAMGVGTDALNCFNANLIPGFRFNTHFSLGGGTGIRIYSTSTKGKPFSDNHSWYTEPSAQDDLSVTLAIPILSEVRIECADRKFSPYLSLGLGYVIVLNSIEKFHDFQTWVTPTPISPDEVKRRLNKGGLFINPVFGFRFIVNGKNTLHAGISYEFQRVRVDYSQQYHGYTGGSAGSYIRFSHHVLETVNSHSIGIVAGVSFSKNLHAK